MKDTVKVRGCILVAPIDEQDEEAQVEIAREIERVYAIPCKTASLIQDISFAFDPHRNQFNSTLILKELEAHAPDNVLKVMALTSSDLFIPILTYVYGEAQLGGRCAIVSSNRLREGISPGMDYRKLFLCRLIKECIHELGHTFALRHCRDRSCIMHYGRDVADVDAKSRQLCRYCGIMLNDELSKIGKGSG